MKNLVTLLCLLATFQLSAQRFDWASFTPLLNNSNDGSGGLCIAKDDDNNLYTASTFRVPVVLGNDTIFPAGPFNTNNTLITKWNPEGDIILTKQIAANPYGISPFDMTYDEVNQQIVLSTGSSSSSIEIIGDTILNGGAITLLRFNKSLDYISDVSLLETYNSPLVSKDGFTYSSNGYSSIIRKYDANNGAIWNLPGSQGSFNITSMAISTRNYIYVVGYLMNNLVNDPATYGNITITAPSTGNYTHTGIFKLDTAGNVLAGSYLAECAGYGNPLSIAVDADENLFIGAPYSIGGQILGNDTLSNSIGGNDGFVIKMDSLFQPIWTTELHHTGGNLETRAVAIHPSGKVTVIGLYAGDATFGAFPLQTNPYGTGYLIQLENATGDVLYADNFGNLTGTGRPHDLVNIGDKYFMTGLCYSADPNGGSFGCFTETFTTQFLTCFNDTAFQLPTVTLQFNYPALTAASNVPNAVYTWFLDGIEIAGVTGNTITPLTNGTYTVSVETYGCVATETFILTNVGISGAETSLFSVFPNPSNGIFNISQKYGQPEYFDVEVTDLAGKVILSKKAIATGMQLDISNHAPGIYLLRLQNEKGAHMMKLVRE